MPQITLTLSQNVTLTPVEYTKLFTNIHHLLCPIADINKCKSSIHVAEFIHIGEGTHPAAIIALRIGLLPKAERTLIVKQQLGDAALLELQRAFQAKLNETQYVCQPSVEVYDLAVYCSTN